MVYVSALHWPSPILVLFILDTKSELHAHDTRTSDHLHVPNVESNFGRPV